MNNKVLVRLYCPEIESEYDVYIPINEYIWKIKKMLIRSISDITSISLDLSLDYSLFNKDTGQLYKDNDIVYNTDIRNTTTLLITSRCK